MRGDSERIEWPVLLVDGETEFCDEIALTLHQSSLNFRHFNERVRARRCMITVPSHRHFEHAEFSFAPFFSVCTMTEFDNELIEVKTDTGLRTF